MPPYPPIRPMMTPDSGRTVRLGNLDKRVTEDLLWELFVQAGPVLKVVLPKVHTGVAMIEFRSMIDAVYAMVIMNNVALFGKTMDVYHHYKEQYMLEEQEHVKNQPRFYQAPQNMMKKSMNPDHSLLKKALTPDKAKEFGLTEASSSDSDSLHGEDEYKVVESEPPLEEEPFELPSWMTQQSDGSFSRKTPDKYMVSMAPSLDEISQEPMAVPPPPPPPKPPVLPPPASALRSAMRPPSGLPPPPPPPPSGGGGGIMRVTSPVSPPRYGASINRRFVTPPSTPARPGVGGIRVAAPPLSMPAPPPPPSSNRYPRSYGAQY